MQKHGFIDETALPSFAVPSVSDSNGKSNIKVVVRIRPNTDRNALSVIQPVIPDEIEKKAVMPCKSQTKSRNLSPKKSRKTFAFRLTPRKKHNKEKTNGIIPLVRSGHQDTKTALQSNRQFEHVKSLVVGTSEKRRFDFDAVFDPTVSQKDVYDRAIGDAVRSNIIHGYNTCLIAYGQTAAGKTYTMGGRQDVELPVQSELPSETRNLSKCFDSTSESTVVVDSLTDEDGIISRAVHDLFLAKRHHESAGVVTICLTYIEIYNDELRDLLAHESTGESLSLRDHGDDGVIVNNLTSVEVKSTSHVKTLMEEASRRRTAGCTNANKKSSRSHAICNLIVTAQPASKANEKPECRDAISSQLIRAKLTLVDLAGSERIKETGVMGFQKKESININKDLFVLGKVISALSDQSTADGSVKDCLHVPYRDSKLTRLLRDSLGGNCYTVMVACVSPSKENIEESLNTLRYAERTRAITNTVGRNVEKAPLSPAESAAMSCENKLLKAKVAELKKRIRSIERARESAVSAEVEKDDTWLLEVGRTDNAPQRETVDQGGSLDQRQRGFGAEEKLSTVEDMTVPKDLQESYTHQSAELQILKDALQKTTAENDRFKEECKSLKAENAVVSMKLEEKERMISSLMAQLEEEKLLRSKYRKDVESLSEERDVLRVKNAVQADENQRLQQNSTFVASKDTEMEKLRGSIKSLQSENAVLVAKLEEKENRNRSPTDFIISGQSSKIPREALGERNLQDDERNSFDCNKMDDSSTSVKMDDSSTSEHRISTSADTTVAAYDDSSVDIECDSDHNAIRAHATKMLFWADKAIEKGRSCRSVASSVTSSVGTDFMPTLTGVPAASSQRVQLPGRPPRKIEVAKKTVVISNLEQMKTNTACTCQSSLFSGNAEHVDFYLPKLGMACSCGKKTQEVKMESDEDPMAIETILRPWQAAFLRSQGIATAVELVHAQNQRGDALAKEMRKWRKANKLVSVKTKSCGIALHIWSRTCKTIARSVREQRAEGVKNPRKPKFLEVSVPSDNRSMSTLGCGSMAEMRCEYEI